MPLPDLSQSAADAAAVLAEVAAVSGPVSAAAAAGIKSAAAWPSNSAYARAGAATVGQEAAGAAQRPNYALQYAQEKQQRQAGRHQAQQKQQRRQRLDTGEEQAGRRQATSSGFSWLYLLCCRLSATPTALQAMSASLTGLSAPVLTCPTACRGRKRGWRDSSSGSDSGARQPLPAC
jgi:hypothetical protein